MSLLTGGTNDYAENTGTPPVTTYPFTVSLWYKRDDSGAPNIRSLFTIGQSGADNNFFSVLANSTGGAVARVKGASTTSSATSSNTVLDANWHHICAIFASDTSRTVYHDGDTANEGTNSTSNTPSAATMLRLASHMDGVQDFPGRLAYVGVWDSVLSESSAVALAGGSVPTSVDAENLVLYYSTLATGSAVGTDDVGGYDLTLIGDAAYSADNPTLAALFLKLLTDASAASASSIEGVVLNATRDTVIGEFSGQAFEASLEAGEAVLLIDVADITPDGSTLTTSDTPIVFAYNATDSIIGPGSATVIEV